VGAEGLWGFIVERLGWQVFPLERKLFLTNLALRWNEGGIKVGRKGENGPWRKSSSVARSRLDPHPDYVDALPITPDQIATQAIDAARLAPHSAFARRDPKDGRPSSDAAVFMQFLRASSRRPMRCEHHHRRCGTMTVDQRISAQTLCLQKCVR